MHRGTVHRHPDYRHIPNISQMAPPRRSGPPWRAFATPPLRTRTERSIYYQEFKQEFKRGDRMVATRQQLAAAPTIAL
jgi:hypothetical protein